jgi:hypothetical protein
MIKNDRKIRANTPKYFKSDETKSAGYLFFTDELEDAAIYGISTALIDINNLSEPISRDLAFKGRDIIILALRTSGLKDRIELDPDSINHKHNFSELAKTLPRAADFIKSTWYRVKDDINIGNVFAYRMTPFDKVDQGTIETILAGIIITDLNEIKLEKMKT